MSSAEFVEVLEQFKGLKSGISGSRIKKLTEIAVNNVSAESEIVDKTFENLKAIQDSHKLGALYIIDSIARKYKDQASKAGQSISPSAPQGTFAHGVYKFGTIIQEAVDITIPALTPEQKEKVGKLLDIWRKGDVFSSDTIDAIKAKYYPSTGNSAPVVTTTSSASPAPAQAQAQAQPVSSFDILSNLAASAATAQTASQPSTQPAGFPQGLPQGFPTLPNLGADPNAQQAVVLQMLQQLQASGQLPPMPQPPVAQFQQPFPESNNDNRDRFRNPIAGSQEDAFKNFKTGGRQDYRERDSGYSRRGNRDRGQSPNRRNEGRERPPQGHVEGEKNLPGTPHYREKPVSHDPTVPAGHIKVLSRTLFVGGVPTYMTQEELASIMRPYAEVQSVILHNERKHAFVKVYSRKEAENVIANFNKNGQYNLRIRWGVGFGPRECCDYQHGISIIGIERLTDADIRWVSEAQWGGIGRDTPFAAGLSMEEPDIEIGEGISSKAISQKMPTDGSRNGPRSTKPGEPDDFYTDPLNKASLPSFMQGSNKANPLANLFGGQAAAPAAVVAQAPAPAPTGGATDNAQLSNLMAFLQSQQK